EPDESNWSFSSVECPDALEIDVEIGVRTDNGALEEKASTTLSSRQPLLVTGRLDLIPGAMSGSWHLTYEASASQGGGETVKSADFLEPHLWFGFTPGGLVSGGFDTGVEVVTESAAGLSEVSF